MATVGKEIRMNLQLLHVGESTNFMVTQKTTVALQMEDLRLFSGKSYKSHVDKSRHEMVVTRIS